MAEYSQSAEIETICDEPIAAQNDSTNMEQKLTLPWAMPEQIILNVPRQLLVGMVEVSMSAKTETSGHVSIAIQKDRKSLEQKLNLPWTRPTQKILRVHHQLLKVNEKAYEPYTVSIGPYHRGKDHLEEMEGQKVRSLESLLQLTKQRVEEYQSAMGNMVEKARNCYSEPLDISREEFVDMMVLDGCFIIQFLGGELEEFCYSSLTERSILHDLALVENQLPFFVLRELLDIIPRSFFRSEKLKGSADPKSWLISNLLEKFKDQMPGLEVNKTYDDDSIKNVKHIVHLLLCNWLPSDNGTSECPAQPIDRKWKCIRSATELRDLLLCNWLPSDNGTSECPAQPIDRKWKYIRSATELREAGIEFKKVETREHEQKRLFDINFDKGILEMPPVKITHSTESLYRNLMACEQFDNYKCSNMFLAEYVTLMDSLINSRKDVKLLCKRGIIDNWLGDDEAVAVLFNRLRDHINLPEHRFFYAQLFRDINKYYEAPRHAWMAKLRHKYFNTPWAFISFLAATLLLLFSAIQTIFAIFPRS